MIHYYTYYSVGGYKDMYLGNQSMNDCEATYYLPLLQVMEGEAIEKNDNHKLSEISKMKQLPPIVIATSTNRMGLPQVATTLTTKGCYRLLYSHLEGEKYAVILHDVVNGSKDEVGRSIPFLVMWMCDSIKDLVAMDKLALYCASHMESAINTLGAFFGYDMHVNGLRFELAKMNQWMKDVVNRSIPPLLHVSGRPIYIHAINNHVALMVVRHGIKARDAKSVLNSAMPYDEVVSESDLQPQDNNAVAAANVEAWKDHRHQLVTKYIMLAADVAVIALIVYGIFWLISSCSQG